MIAFLARTWPDLEYPLLMMAVGIFVIVGTLWLFIRPDVDFATLVALVRRNPAKSGVWLLIIAAGLAIVYVVDESRS